MRQVLEAPPITAIKVIGCGGIGLCILPVLSRYLNYHPELDNIDVTLIDGDEYEAKNADRQQFAEMGNKAEVTKNAYEQEYRSIYFSAVSEYLTPDNIAFHIREKDIVFLCVDNHATRKLVVDECQNLENVILISGGNDYYDGNVSVYIRVDGVDITNPPTVTHPEIAEPKDKNPGTLEQREGGGCANEAASAPQLLITNNIIAAFMLSAFLQVVEGKHGNYGDLFVDAIRSTSRHNDRGMPKAATRIA